eukprot:CAMPEP_0201548106 /NCGR_PEP_ID=MMETSP0173_2-20130828/4602_1 /ASSEMBLY_ACC=CAM_ASM_000268 /TAXON_ID=218659 /ORGANISM="Vexillifera sp., Strain DIVA3 564/2" /LENGTH=290 /DNA_ID=CAMNT_0047957369 /DNA_START=36 /DNA_END=908 /DNA_ORIENTATION=-
MSASANNSSKQVIKSSATYQGEFNDVHQKHGKGVLTWDDGDRFEGEFRNDQKVHGTFTWKCGDKYTGDWKNSLMDGNGTYYYKDGRKYEGQWVEGFKDGRGKFTWRSGGSYQGFFQRDKCQGLGIMQEADDRVYMGEWLANQKHGYGVMKWPNGEKSEACWQSNMRCGLSIFVDANGNRYIEKWNRGSREGPRIRLKRTEAEMKPFLEATKKPQWAPDSGFKNCFKCDTPFTVMNRRHHCRHCGYVFCNACTTKRLPIPRIGVDIPSRVCDECFVCIQIHDVLEQLDRYN